MHMVSMLHHFFVHHGLGEKTVHLHADMGRIRMPPWCSTESDDRPAHIVVHDPWPHEVQSRLVLWSSQVVQEDQGWRLDRSGQGRDHSECRSSHWTWGWEWRCSWQQKLVGIKKFHHLRFDSASPGYVFVKKSESPEINTEAGGLVTLVRHFTRAPTTTVVVPPRLYSRICVTDHEGHHMPTAEWATALTSAPSNTDPFNSSPSSTTSQPSLTHYQPQHRPLQQFPLLMSPDRTQCPNLSVKLKTF